MFRYVKKNILIGFAVLLMMSAAVSADENVEWKSYQNSVTNNGVGAYKTPYIANETGLAWEKQLVGDYTTSFTPPIIVNGYLYTAAGNRIKRLSKVDGSQVVRPGEDPEGSEPFYDNSDAGYGMHPITYAEGLLFVPIGNGRIQAFREKDLKSVWVSGTKGLYETKKTWSVEKKKYVYEKIYKDISGQSITTITYRNGMVYTGYWKEEEKEAAYAAYSIKDRQPENSEEENQPVWTFWTSKRDGRNAGFYWAGAYANENFVAFGSDDGSYSVGKSALYTVHPKTGKTISVRKNLTGDIRSNVVYYKSHLFFVSKGGYLYKVPVSKKGYLGRVSAYPLGGMATASPVIYNDRIYVGVAGKQQFQANSGHHIAVIKNTGRLSKKSLIYKSYCIGYPQAAALVSTQHVNNDFYNTGRKSRRVYVYFTYNTPPGGMGYLIDEPGKKSGTVRYIYKPELDSRQFGISPICVDNTGRMYFKNDSGKLFAVDRKPAYLKDVEVKAKMNDGTYEDVDWGNEEFETGVLNYRVVFPEKAEKLKIKLDIPKGQQATVDGVKYEGEVELEPNADATPKEVEIEVTKGSSNRIYTLKLIRMMNDVTLKGVDFNQENAHNEPFIDHETPFNPEAEKIRVNVKPILVEYMGELKYEYMVNMWPNKTDEHSNIGVIPVDNVKYEEGDPENYTIEYFDEHGKLQKAKSIPKIQSATGKYRFFIKPKDQQNPGLSKAKIIVVSKDKKKHKIYEVEVNWLNADT